MKKTIALLIIFFALFNCERDDICSESTPTTPHLFIEFYNIIEPTEAESVVGLQIQSVDDDTRIYQEAASTSSVLIPLRTIDNDDDDENGIITKFKFHKEYEEDDDGNVIGGNEDIITITYYTEKVYVSRACGYKTIFENVSVTVEEDGEKWIQLLQFSDQPLTITNETEAHVQIFH